MGLFKFSKRNLDASKVETLVGEEATVQGVLSPKGSLRVDGRIDGSISDAQAVVVGDHGLVRGDISAENVVVGGKVIGNITATELIEILAGGHVHGDLRTPRLLIEETGIFNGRCTMESGDLVEEVLQEAVSEEKG